MAFDINILPTWKGKYPMSDTTHADDLQMRSDIYRHMHRLPEHEADARGYADYRKEQVQKAAAHHWNGMKAAAAAGNDEGAKKHGVMYTLAMHQLGHKDLMTPPDEVQEFAKDPKQAIGNFKAHPGDAYSMPPPAPEDGERKPKLNEKQVKDAAAAKPMAKSQEGDRDEPDQTPVAEVQSPKCSSCGGPFHPDTGHHPEGHDDVNVCGPCARHFISWLKQHLRRPYGSKETPFYDAAATSIKPGMKGSDEG